MEGRELPSAIVIGPPTPPLLGQPLLAAPAAMSPPAPTVVTPPAASSSHPLAGSGSGSYVCTLKYADTPSGFHFTGSANLRGMGAVSIQIDAYAVGFKTKGSASGQITLSNAKGTVTLEITGPIQSRLSKLPEWFRYKVVSATGAYSKMTDHGTLRLSRFADRSPIRNGLAFHEAGAFRLII